MEFNIIVAVEKNFGIGKNGVIPWNIPEDLAFFKHITTGTLPTTSQFNKERNAVIMGRRTFMSIGKCLPRRTNIVISRNKESDETKKIIDTLSNHSSSDLLCDSLNYALEYCKRSNFDNVFVIGGEMLYKEAITHPLLNKIYLTSINEKYDCDTFFPQIGNAFTECKRYHLPGNEKHTVFEYGQFNKSEFVYLRILSKLTACPSHSNRTNIQSRSCFGEHMRFPLIAPGFSHGKNASGFSHGKIEQESVASNIIIKIIPLLTTKRVNFKAVYEELLFFLRGETDSKKLESKGVNIWKGNTSRDFLDTNGFSEYQEGEMGPLYGYQWRNWGGKGIDQIKKVIEDIKQDPYSRRHIVSAWNLEDIPKGVLAPCHSFFQFVVIPDGTGKQLNCMLHQRSGDFFLGVPFNICSYALLTHMVAHVTGLTPGEIVINIGDCHLYENQIEQAKIQLKRTPRGYPSIYINEENKKIMSIDDFTSDSITPLNYYPHPFIKADMVA